MPFLQHRPTNESAVKQPSSSVVRRALVRLLGHILAEDAELLVRWRARLTAALLLAGATLGVIPATLTMIMLAGQGEWFLTVVDAVLLSLTFTMLLSERVTNRWRNAFLASAAWLIGVSSIVTLGPFSTALGWMFMSVFMAAFLLSTRATVIVVVTLLLVLAGVALGIVNELLPWARGDATALSRWGLTAIDFSFLISLFAASNRFIMRLLEREDAARVTAEQQLAEGRRNEALGTLASGIAHDFNNLLVPVLANVEMVHDTLPEHSAERAALQDAQRSAERARDLVQRILSFGRTVDANRCALNLADAAAEVMRMIRISLPAHVSLSMNSRTDAAVLASHAEVHQIVHNLVTNAVHAVVQPGKVVVNISGVEIDERQWVRLLVQDTGVGMDAATRERIFDPYFSTREVGRGTGLGLPIVQSLVSSLGGNITVRSAPGQGSTFTVLLPQANLLDSVTQRSVRKAVKTTAGVTSVANATRVLLVDDETTVQKVTARLLSMLGCEVSLANDTADALASISNATEPFDLLVTDYRMPGRSGSELIADALVLHPTLRVILVSGHIESATLPPAFADQVVLLSKPFSRVQLSDALTTALG